MARGCRGLYNSREGYLEAERRLADLPLGSDRWDLFSALEGYLWTRDQANTYTLFMTGCMDFWRGAHWQWMTQEAVYEVLTLGWQESTIFGSREVPEKYVIWRNGKLAEIVPYVPRVELGNGHRTTRLRSGARSESGRYVKLPVAGRFQGARAAARRRGALATPPRSTQCRGRTRVIEASPLFLSRNKNVGESARRPSTRSAQRCLDL